MLTKLNFVFALAALVFFCVPWIGIEWHDEVQSTQTGLQMMMGSGSSVHQPGQSGGGGWGYSYLSGLALVTVLASFLFSFICLIKERDEHATTAGILCGLAFVFLLAQGIIGFPVNAEIQEAQKKAAVGLQSLGGDGALGELIGGFKQQVTNGLKVRRLPWFGLELFALAVPTLMASIQLLRPRTNASLPTPRVWGKLGADER